MRMEFGRGYNNSDKPTEDLFYVNNCGSYKKVDFEMKVNRARGRHDYQIIYVSEGRLWCISDNEKRYAKKGSLIIYKPGEPQVYGCFPEDGASYDWIHFTGSLAEKIMDELKLESGIYDVGAFTSFSHACSEIINECRKNKQSGEIRITGLALSVIGEIPDKIKKIRIQRFEDIVCLMSQDKPNGTKISEYARMSGLSCGHFIKEFRAVYDMSPASYRLWLLIERSKPLLAESDLSIRDIAQRAGFDDALYFSRAFKKITGFSPEKYRIKNKEV
ncbi:MAG: helix-turn-helix transcriptional regulator [Clostridia bacterium]|nr:helix-turn-helix transcriptional regulator [Clostridia bacterium]